MGGGGGSSSSPGPPGPSPLDPPLEANDEGSLSPVDLKKYQYPMSLSLLYASCRMSLSF